MPVLKTLVKAMSEAVDPTSAQPEPQPSQAPQQERAPLALRRSRREASQHIRNQLKIGQAIRNQRIGSLWDLDQARVEKQEWVLRTSDLLAQLFSNETLAEQCNDWVGTILPEYADVHLFVDQFEQEMKHRLGRLQNVLKMLDNIPEPPSSVTPEPAAEVIAPKAIITSSAPAAATEPVAANVQAQAPVVEPTTAPVASAPAQQAIVSPSSYSSSSTTSASPSNGRTQRPMLALVVHGQVESARLEDVTKLLEKLGLSAASIENVTAQTFPMDAAMIDPRGCAIVLLGDAAPETAQGSDLLFVLGCCVGRFGAGRVSVLQAAADAQHSDVAALDRAGLAPLRVDAGEGWKLQLARQLRAAGMAVDLNRLV